WRYAVKSMAGEKLTSTRAGPLGIVGDRVWAMHDDAEILSARHYPKFLMCAARYLEEPGEGKNTVAQVEFPDGSKVMSSDASAGAKLTALIGKPISLKPLQPVEDLDYYRRRPRTEAEMMAYLGQQFGREPGEPMPDMTQFPQELMEFAAFPGMHFDVTPLQLLTTASLAHMTAKNPGANWDVRRFRPNVLIETNGGLTGLVEAEWAGKSLRIGELTVHCPGPTPRCAMTMQAQRDFPFDRTILRTIVREGSQNLGAYATAGNVGKISVGDAVELI
ncbi:MAG: hypothetical protein A3H91_07880, partial [Gammaproteobacteria bacterium RIFCSPLOWO2_02_FULL_61_13]